MRLFQFNDRNTRGIGQPVKQSAVLPQFSMDDMRKFTVPDFGAIGDAAVTQLAAAYDELSNRTLLPLPEMNGCDVRRALDDAVCAALDMDPERVAAVRLNLAAEPSVTGQRYAGRLG